MDCFFFSFFSNYVLHTTCFLVNIHIYFIFFSLFFVNLSNLFVFDSFRS